MASRRSRAVAALIRGNHRSRDSQGRVTSSGRSQAAGQLLLLGWDGGEKSRRKYRQSPAQSLMVGAVVNPRWVSTGWVIFNNKGKPVRQYEPYFSQLPEKWPLFRVRRSEPALAPYSSTIPLDRVIAVLHPNHSYEKAVVDPWQQVNFDTNDTVAPDGAETGDPRTDPDIKGYVAEYFKTAARDLADMVSAAHRGEAAPPPPPPPPPEKPRRRQKRLFTPTHRPCRTWTRSGAASSPSSTTRPNTATRPPGMHAAHRGVL